jgi:hypothetical protein
VSDPKKPSDGSGLLKNLAGSTALSSALFTVQTPFPGAGPYPAVPQATLLRETWENHIVGHHAYMADRLALVQATASAPTVIVPGTSNPDYLIFVNEGETTSEGHPLTVIINPSVQIIVTAMYNRSYREIAPGIVLWRP